jgi:TetR/AcrR family transcriptional regulator, fatty acid metabolism regulator protein
VSKVTEKYVPPKSKGEASRSRLLEVAAQLFAERGFEQTKISDIVKAAGVTQPSFYLYFENKEAVFAELSSQMVKRLGELLLELGQFQAGEDLAQKTEANLLAIFSLLNQNSDLTRIGLEHAAQAPLLFATMEQMMVAQLAQIKQQLKPDLDLELAASAMIGMVKHFIHTQLITKKRSPEELAKFCSDFQLFGIAKSKV